MTNETTADTNNDIHNLAVILYAIHRAFLMLDAIKINRPVIVTEAIAYLEDLYRRVASGIIAKGGEIINIQGDGALISDRPLVIDLNKEPLHTYDRGRGLAEQFINFYQHQNPFDFFYKPL